MRTCPRRTRSGISLRQPRRCRTTAGRCCGPLALAHVADRTDDGVSDLVFIQDCTGSQGSYISAATKNIEVICDAIFESGKLQAREDLRVGLVAYRDHPPQDHTYVTKNFGFTSDVQAVREQLKGLYASGGGDGPEAVTAALAEVLNMDWRENASRMVVLIADAPSHGIGEFGDGQREIRVSSLGSDTFQDSIADLRTEMTRFSSHAHSRKLV
jgi:hypothetical protein